MNPRERIATILFIEQLKRANPTAFKSAEFKDLVLKKECETDELIE